MLLLEHSAILLTCIKGLLVFETIFGVAVHNVITVDKLTEQGSFQPLKYATNSMVDNLKFQTLFSKKCW